MFIRVIALSLIYKATNFELLISCLLFQLTFITTFVAFKRKRGLVLPWLLLFVNCLTYYWDTDFFSYMDDFYNGLELTGEKEILYKYIYNITKPYYLLWRAVVWGSAVLLYYYTSKRLKINTNYSIYVLIFLYLPLFVYGRVILAMTIYFFGFSFILTSSRRNLISSFLLGFFIASLAFFAHRSILPLIVLFPLFAIPRQKSYYKWLLFSSPLLFIVMQYVITRFSSGSIVMGGMFDSFQSSAERSVSGDYIAVRNWKNQLMFWIRNISLVIPILFVFWKYIRGEININSRILPLLFVSMFIVLFSSFLYFGVMLFDTSTLSMRYLNMTGIPVCLLLSFLCQNRTISKKTLNCLIFTGFATTELLFITAYLFHGYEIV